MMKTIVNGENKMDEQNGLSKPKYREDDYHRTQREKVEELDSRMKIVEEKLSKRGRPPKVKETKDADADIGSNTSTGSK